MTHFAPIAATSGLVDLVCDLISQWKRLEIWPEQFEQACTADGLTRKDREVLDLYQMYQQHLREHHRYDAEGRFWTARDWLKQTWSAGANDSARPWPRLRLVVADGFTDFTRTQHEILEILGQGVAEICVSLPLDRSRTELFAKPLKTLDELQWRHAGLVIEELPQPERPAWPAMARLERRLFGNPRDAAGAEEDIALPDTRGLEVLAAASPLGEIEQIGERIKRLLVEGDAGRPVRPDEIAIVFRSQQDPSGLLGEVFADLGIPVAFEAGRWLGRAPAVVALMALLQLDADDWPLRALLAVLGSNYFRPDWPQWLERGTLAAADRAIRRLQIPQGRTELLERLERAASSDAAAARALPLLQRLAAALDELPEQTTLADWGRAWHRLAVQTGLWKTIEGGAAEGLSAEMLAADQAAWNCLHAVLAESAALAESLGGASPELDRRDALLALRDLAGSERFGATRRRLGPRANPLGRQCPRAEGALFVSRRAVREGISKPGTRRPPLQRGRVRSD